MFSADPLTRFYSRPQSTHGAPIFTYLPVAPQLRAADYEKAEPGPKLNARLPVPANPSPRPIRPAPPAASAGNRVSPLDAFFGIDRADRAISMLRGNGLATNASTATGDPTVMTGTLKKVMVAGAPPQNQGAIPPGAFSFVGQFGFRKLGREQAPGGGSSGGGQSGGGSGGGSGNESRGGGGTRPTF